MEQKKISVIQVPFGLGSSRNGTELGPESMKATGLFRQIRQLGYEVVAEPTVAPGASPQAGDAEKSGVKHLAAVRDMARRVAGHVSEAIGAGSFPLVVGGDRSVAIGALAGVTARSANAGAIFFNAFGDLNDESSLPSGFANGMAIAVALGQAGFKLTDVDAGARFLNKDNIVLIGLRHLEPREKDVIRTLGIRYFTMYDIDKIGIERVVEQAVEIAGAGTDGIHVSFAADCLDPLEAPGVSSPIPGGLSYREAHFACELLAETGRVRSMDVTEVNAALDENRRTARLAVGLVASTLGKRIM